MSLYEVPQLTLNLIVNLRSGQKIVFEGGMLLADLHTMLKPIEGDLDGLKCTLSYPALNESGYSKYLSDDTADRLINILRTMRGIVEVNPDEVRKAVS